MELAVSEPVTSPVNAPTSDRAGVEVEFMTVPVNPPPFVNENDVTVPVPPVAAIVMLEPAGVIEMTVPARRVKDNVSQF
jgi:hypothetical protein